MQLPNLLIAALVLAGFAFVLFLLGLILQAVPDDLDFGDISVGAYDVADFVPAIYALLVPAGVCAGIGLGRYENKWARAVGVTLVALAGIAVVVVVLGLLLIVALCSGGGCD